MLRSSLGLCLLSARRAREGPYVRRVPEIFCLQAPFYNVSMFVTELYPGAGLVLGWFRHEQRVIGDVHLDPPPLMSV